MLLFASCKVRCVYTASLQAERNRLSRLRLLLPAMSAGGKRFRWIALAVALSIATSLARQPLTFSRTRGGKLPSNFYTSAESQNPTNYKLTEQDRSLLREVHKAANRRQWREVQALQGSATVPKTPFFNAEMNAALKCRKYRAGAAL